MPQPPPIHWIREAGRKTSPRPHSKRKAAKYWEIYTPKTASTADKKGGAKRAALEPIDLDASIHLNLARFSGISLGQCQIQNPVFDVCADLGFLNGHI